MKWTIQLISVWASVLFGAVAAAQTVDLAAPTGRQIVNGTVSGAKAGIWLDVGDVSGDVYNKDLIVGAPDASSGRGEVRVLFGWVQHTGTFTLDLADVVLTGNAAGDRFGTRTNAGFVTTRNTTPETVARDLVVGAPGASGGRGEVYLFAGPLNSGASLTPANAVFRIIGAAGDQLGSWVETADMNGDGYREIVAGAAGTGRVYVVDYHNASGSVRDLATQSAEETISGAGIGGVLAAGDITGDSRFDLIVGAPSAANGAGTVYIITGRAAGPLRPTVNLPADADVVFQGVDAGDHAGTALWIKEDGDIDEDGRWDLVIAAPDADGPGNARPDAGEVYIVFGRPTFAATVGADATFYGAAAGYHLGTRVRSGDITRDAPDDLAMLAPGANGGSGEAYVYYGRPRFQFPAAIDFASSAADRRLISDGPQGAIQTMVVWEVTGEGAEDLVFGVPSANSGAGRLYFSISPTLSAVAQAGATATGQDLIVNLILNPGQVWSTPIRLRNITTIPVTWGVSSDRSWLAASQTSGTATATQDGYFYLVTSAQGLPEGAYSGTMRVFSTSRDLDTSLLISVRITVAPAMRDPGDFSGDGGADLVWQHQTLGFLSLWRMNGTAMQSGDSLNPGQVTALDWKIVGTGDFNGDGHPDLLWRDQSQGLLSAWLMNGVNQVAGVSLVPDRVSDTNWRIAATGDFNGDGRRDIIWQHQTEGLISVWLMNGTTLIDGQLLTPDRVADTNWKIVGAGDFNGDRRTDLVWQNQTTGGLSVWYMNGTQLIDGVWITPSHVPDTNWKIRAVTDLNRDGKPDLVWQHTSSGALAVWFMNGVVQMSGTSLSPATVSDLNWKIVGPR